MIGRSKINEMNERLPDGDVRCQCIIEILFFKRYNKHVIPIRLSLL